MTAVLSEELKDMILRAAEKDLDMIVKITHTTISEIYSRYYAKGVVDFFLKHHSRQNILADIQNDIVWMLEEDDCLVGTVTVKKMR